MLQARADLRRAKLEGLLSEGRGMLPEEPTPEGGHTL